MHLVFRSSSCSDVGTQETKFGPTIPLGTPCLLLGCTICQQHGKFEMQPDVPWWVLQKESRVWVYHGVAKGALQQGGHYLANTSFQVGNKMASGNGQSQPSMWIAELIGKLGKAGVEGRAFPWSSAKHIAWHQFIQVKNQWPWSGWWWWHFWMFGLEKLLEGATPGIQGSQIHQEMAMDKWQRVPLHGVKLHLVSFVLVHLALLGG